MRDDISQQGISIEGLAETAREIASFWLKARKPPYYEDLIQEMVIAGWSLLDSRENFPEADFMVYIRRHMNNVGSSFAHKESRRSQKEISVGLRDSAVSVNIDNDGETPSPEEAQSSLGIIQKLITELDEEVILSDRDKKILAALVETEGNKTDAAALLGLFPKDIYNALAYIKRKLEKKREGIRPKRVEAA